MASTYTTTLALQLMATGENAGTWGAITNTNLVVVQQAIAGYQAVSIAGGAQTTALVVTQNAVSNAKNAVLKFTGTITGNQIVTVPNGITKTWIVSNGTTGAFTVTFKYASTGTGQTWTTTDKGIKILYSDGTDIQVTDLSTLSGQLVSAQIANYAVNTAELATNAVTAVKITQSTITQSKLAANSVGANQLIATAVTPGSYTKISITVDADGRITSASSGAGSSAGMEIPTRFTIGPSSGTHTASPSANRLGVYMYSAGGGGGGGSNLQARTGGSGGVGGYGFYNKPITQPFSQPFSVGGAGNGGIANNTPSPGAAGNSGGATTIANVGTVNGGLGGNGGGTANGNTGASGTQPGSTLSGFPKTFILGSYGPSAGGNVGNGGNGTESFMETPIPANPGNSGSGGGVLVVFENIGT
jgi:hypothetical protein